MTRNISYRARTTTITC